MILRMQALEAFDGMGYPETVSKDSEVGRHTRMGPARFEYPRLQLRANSDALRLFPNDC